MPDAITLGELLIDFVPTLSGVSLVEAPAFVKAAGGAPANVAVGLARLGVSSGFMGKVGDDAFGRFLARTLAEASVDVSCLRFTTQARTGLSFMSLRADGERDFLFYRHPSADMLYTPEEVDAGAAYLRQAKALHFGSISLIGEPSRSATLRAVQVAHEAGLLISYDPNLRLDLWPEADERAARAGIMLGWTRAGVIKLNEEELIFLSGKEDWVSGARSLWHPGLRLLVVTRGKEGCAYVTTEFSGEVPGFEAATIDTTGAGDGFVAGLLKGLLQHPGAMDNEVMLRSICRYANAVGALTTTERGAIPALPDLVRVSEFSENSP